MTAITEFVDYTAPYCPSCPATLIRREIMSSAIEFCDRTELWGYESYAMPSIDGINQYDFRIPSTKADPMQLVSVKFKGKPLKPVTTMQLDRMYSDWRSRSGTPRAYVQESSHTKIMLDAKPKETEVQALTATFLLRPDRTATELPDFLYQDWLEAICAGALRRILILPNKAWTDPKLAQTKANEFQQAVSKGIAQGKRQWGNVEFKSHGRKIVSR